MQVNRISAVNFCAQSEDADKVFVTKETKENAEKLLRMMNQGTVYKENEAGTGWESSILASVGVDNNKIKFIDNRMYICPVKKPKEFIPDCTLYMGKNYIHFSSQTGEILGYKKGWLSTWKGFLSKVEAYVKEFVANFDNSEVVTKNKFPIAGFTQKGLKIFQKAAYKR